MPEKAVVWNEEILGNVRAVNEVVLANSERMVAMNLAFLRRQADVTLAAMRAAMDVKDLNGMQAYMASQGEVAREVAEGMVADAKVVAQLGAETVAEVTDIVSANVEAAKKAA